MDHPALHARVVDAFQRALFDDAAWLQASSLLGEACGSVGAFFVLADRPTVPPSSACRVLMARCSYQGRDRPDVCRTYFRDYYPTDERIPRVLALPDSKVVAVSDVFTRHQMQTSRVYNEYLVRYPAQNGLQVRLDGPDGSQIVALLGDPVGAQGWTAARVAALRYLLPHLRQYIHVRGALAGAEAVASSLAALLETARLSVFQLDADGRIVHASDPALELLRDRHSALRDRDGRLRALFPGDDARLQNLVARAVPSVPPPRAGGSMLVRRSALLAPLVVHLTPVVAGLGGGDRPRGVAVLVLVVDPLRRPRFPPALVARVLGLSPTEAEVAVLLAEGRTLRQIAEMNGRAYNTVRAHLQNIFAKLGVSRQLELAQLVWTLPNLTSASGS